MADAVTPDLIARAVERLRLRLRRAEHERTELIIFDPSVEALGVLEPGLAEKADLLVPDRQSLLVRRALRIKYEMRKRRLICRVVVRPLHLTSPSPLTNQCPDT
ncbi:hypothetical protein [Bradyrhizobium sp. USDA 376]